MAWGSFHRFGPALGRILIAGIFLVVGANKFMEPAMNIAYMTAHGVPNANVIVYIAGALEIVGALMLIFGLYARLGALLLFIYLIPVCYFFHAFWNVPQDQMAMQMTAFLKNMAIMGGLLYVTAFGSGRFSVTQH